jgi:hypothetical protein
MDATPPFVIGTGVVERHHRLAVSPSLTLRERSGPGAVGADVWEMQNHRSA